MLLDANLLLYAVDEHSEVHAAAKAWLIDALSSGQRVAIPWQTIGAFVRISTHPRITSSPLTGGQAWDLVQRWLTLSSVWIPGATEQTAAIYGRLNAIRPITGNLVPDGQLAALAIEYGLTLYSTDSDFERFEGLTWRNPLR